MPATKVAILGGGMGSLTAAWRLAEAGGYDITVYQRGWRLGGKGASGRNAGVYDRIEEHGLHVLMGFYDRSFGLLKAAYESNPPSTHGPLLTWGAGPNETFTPCDYCGFSQLWNGRWDFFEIPFPPKPGNPWDGNKNPDFIALLDEAVEIFFDLLGALQLGAGLSLGSILAVLFGSKLVKKIQGLSAATIEKLLKVIWKMIDHPMFLNEPKIRWLWMALCFVGGNIIGVIRSGLVVPNPNFETIDGEDYEDWLQKHLSAVGCPPELGSKSPFVTALYDLVFSSGTTLAAGVTVNAALRMALDYRGHVSYKMNAGMGDVVFAPLYLALAAKNVKFRFFNRVKALRTDGVKVTAIEIEEQVDTGGAYDPLVTVNNHPCWPNEPKTTLLSAKYQADHATKKGMPFNFEYEAQPSPYKTADPILAHGKDFDLVVLGISVGALRTIGADLAAANQGFKDACSNLATVPTQSLQLWLSADSKKLGTGVPHGMAISYERPFNSSATMDQVMPAESWPAGSVAQVVYFCDEFPSSIAPVIAPAKVSANAAAFIALGVYGLWPGFDATKQVVSQYVRVNVDPSDGYVLSEKNATQYRLPSGKSGFHNLALAGDWVRTSMNAGCLEGATQGGLSAAEAILGGTVYS